MPPNPSITVPIQSAVASDKVGVYLCSLKNLIHDIRDLRLRDVHLVALGRTPFWNLISAIRRGEISYEHCMKDDKAIRKIINAFDSDTESFNFGSKRIKLRCKDAKLIFGIKDGAGPIILNQFNYEKTQFYYDCFRNKPLIKGKDVRLKRAIILESMNERIMGNDEQDFKYVASLVTLHVLDTLFVASKSSYIPWCYTELVTDIDSICKYDWSGHIVSQLLESIRRNTNGNADKCLLMLPYWLCEHSNIVAPKEGYTFPRLLKWDLREANLVVLSTDIMNLGTHYKLSRKLKITDHEKDLLWETGEQHQDPQPDCMEHMDIDPLQVSSPVGNMDDPGWPVLPNVNGTLNGQIVGAVNQMMQAPAGAGISFTGESGDALTLVADKKLDSTRPSIKLPSIFSNDELILHLERKDVRIKELEATIEDLSHKNIEQSKLNEQMMEDICKLKEVAELFNQLNAPPTTTQVIDSPLGEMHLQLVEARAQIGEMHDKLLNLSARNDELEEELSKVQKVDELKVPPKKKVAKDPIEPSSMVRNIQ